MEIGDLVAALPVREIGGVLPLIFAGILAPIPALGYWAVTDRKPGSWRTALYIWAWGMFILGGLGTGVTALNASATDTRDLRLQGYSITSLTDEKGVLTRGSATVFVRVEQEGDMRMLYVIDISDPNAVDSE